MTSDSEFNTIRPYCDSEIEAAIERLCKSEEFLTLFTHLTNWSTKILLIFLCPIIGISFSIRPS